MIIGAAGGMNGGQGQPSPPGMLDQTGKPADRTLVLVLLHNLESHQTVLLISQLM
jgi:hypothetical protein